MEGYAIDGDAEAVSALYTDIGYVQGKLGGAIKKNRTVVVRHKSGGQHSYSYATLDAILAAASGPLAEKGMAIVQFPAPSDGGTHLITMLTHPKGATLTVRMPLRASGDIQELGKAITYMRRYVAQGLLGLAAEEDSDGPGRQGEESRSSGPRQSAQGRPKQSRPSKQQSQKKKSEMSPEQAKEAAQVKAMLAAKRIELGHDWYRQIVGEEPTSLAEAKAACVRLAEAEKMAAVEPPPTQDAKDVVAESRDGQEVRNWQNDL